MEDEIPLVEELIPEEIIPTELPFSDDQILVTLQNIHETMAWNYAAQWIIICLLFFLLFFTALGVGKK